MPMFKCKSCGGDIHAEGGQSVAVCPYCDREQSLSKSKNEIVVNLFNRANALRLKNEFDKACETYERIVADSPDDAEAHWGIVLSKYGIEYVEDPDTHKRIPTCHRMQYESILTDVDYTEALQNADASQKLCYERDAREIAELQKDILEIVQNEPPFDVFICYKEKDAEGRRTQESVIANDIYYQLTQEGLKVFYAAITLEDKLGEAYEPYIFAALNSAKVMLVLATTPEHVNAVWVKNEWSRFLKLAKKDRSRLLIPCYRDMDAYDLPEDFSHLQAQDMSKIGFITDVIRGVRKVLSGEVSATDKESGSAGNELNSASLLKRVYLFLEDGEWQSADEYCERILDADPENAQAYLAKLLAELQIKNFDELVNCEAILESNSNYQKAIRFGDDKLKKQLQECNDDIIKKKQEKQLRDTYQNAVEKMSHAVTRKDLDDAATQFEQIIGYLDSKELYQQCKVEWDNREAFVSGMFSLYEHIEKADGELENLSKQCENFQKEMDRLIEQKKERMLIQEEYERLNEQKNSLIAEQERLLLEKKETGLFEIRKKMEITREIESLEQSLSAVKEKLYKKNVQLKSIPTVENITLRMEDFERKLQEAHALCQKINQDSRLARAQYKISEEKILDEKYLCIALSKAKPILAKNKGLVLRILKSQDIMSNPTLLADFLQDKTAWNILSRDMDIVEAIYYADNLMDRLSESLRLKVQALVSGTVLMGKYPQKYDKTELPIAWEVIHKTEKHIYLLSKYCLEARWFDPNPNYDNYIVLWSDCELRKWLNGEFFYSAFSAEEQALIGNTITANWLWSDTEGNQSVRRIADSADRVFLLSGEELQAWVRKEILPGIPTEAAKRNGVTQYNNGECAWWLRTTVHDCVCQVYCVTSGGEIYPKSCGSKMFIGGVRPCIRIDI